MTRVRQRAVCRHESLVRVRSPNASRAFASFRLWGTNDNYVSLLENGSDPGSTFIAPSTHGKLESRLIIGARAAGGATRAETRVDPRRPERPH